jgi:inosine-uridine nucleoside N-ribohydrolase
MFDIAPILWSFDRSSYQTKPMAIRVETKGEYTRGVTIPIPNAAPNAEVSVGVDESEVMRMFMETLCPN